MKINGSSHNDTNATTDINRNNNENYSSNQDYYQSIFIACGETRIDQLYSTEYLEFIILLKKYLDVFIKIILGKLEPGPTFRLGEEARKIKIPKKSKMLKRLVFKKLITIRSAWILDTLKSMNSADLGSETVKKVQDASSINACLEETIHPDILTRMFQDGLNAGILNWITIQELLLEKFYNDLHIYSRSQEIMTEVFKPLGKHRAIEIMLGGFVANQVFKVGYNQTEKNINKNGSIFTGIASIRPNESRSEVGDSIFGGWEGQPQEVVEDFVEFRRTEPLQFKLKVEDHENLLNFFDAGMDSRSMMSFDGGDHGFHG